MLRAVGFSEGELKLAFTEQGLSSQDADELTKEAFWGAVGRGLATAGKSVSKLFGGGKGLQGFGKLRSAAGTAPKSSYLQDFGSFQTMMKGMKPNLGQRIGTSMMSAGKGLETAPGATLWGGVKNFGKGMMFSPHAKGMGAGLGKGFAGYQIGSMLLGPGSSPPPQPIQRPSMYGRY